MTTLITILILGLCIFGMASGLIFAKKALRKGCSDSPENCSCRQENKDPADCDQN